MTTETKSDLSRTFLHFFVNNGQRYCGIPGLLHVKLDTDMPFGGIKDWVVRSDIPAAEIGETDCRRYGIQLHDSRELLGKLDAVVAQIGGIHDVVVGILRAPEFDVPAIRGDAAESRRLLGVLLAQTAPPTSPRLTYTVAAGDTLTRIANRFGASVAQLQEWNAITDPNTLVVGRTVTVSP